MEHEVYVPFPADSVRAALAERERVARCLPGLRPDAVEGEEAARGGRLSGRLRLRVGGSTITYRGSLKFSPRGGGFAVDGEGTEARGNGTVRLSLVVEPRDAEDARGSWLVCSGSVVRDGRLADLEEHTAAAAGVRLLDRFGAALADSLSEEGAPSPASGGIGEPDDNEPAIPGIPGPESGAARPEGEAPGVHEPADVPEPPERAEEPEQEEGLAPAESAPEEPSAAEEGVEGSGLFEAEIPPSSLDPAEEGEREGAGEPSAAEAGHARRTMIGRSAEEVDHAPPRGRYAPIPVPEATGAADTLRWAAPAAAAVLAGALVLGRAWRRRR
ncbi:hypothetical protein [Streptomyces sulphureus]|uniref:hypothetical protein n=1 Tax=Streptomyces sulphureus TaxID=47758 RepID=UPI000371531B|nr:hypothetical protein [Streptomyces sulphureus]